MEKVIISMMEMALPMTIEEMEETYETAYRNDESFKYLMREVFVNEINRRNGKRHLSLEKVKEIYEEKKAALK